jgi:hypothetical protein
MGSPHSRTRGAFSNALLALFTPSFLLAIADAAQPAPFPSGANVLLAGHSFFHPIATKFSEIANQNGYADHNAHVVVSGGDIGTPLGLWESPRRREELTAQLATGEVDLLGLTYQNLSNSSAEHYMRWFDIALEHNPDTQFFFGHPFLPHGPSRTSAEYDEATDQRTDEEMFPVVKQLRAAYPHNSVHYVQYGKVASLMKFLFDAGELPDIVRLLPRPGNTAEQDRALFHDNEVGHAGPMMIEVMSLVWMSLLYGADVDALDFTAYETDVSTIIDEVIVFNLPYQMVGDYNGDGLVNLADYTSWRDAYGQAGLGIATDGNGDSVVDAADYELWRFHYGSDSYGPNSTVSVPEPASVLTCIAVLCLAAVSARR